MAGHGVGPALLMAATRAYLRAFAPRGASPEEVLAAVNRPLTVDIAGGPQFVTLLLMRLRLETGAMTYASAGHNTAFHIDARGHVKAELPSTSMPLGLFPEAEFEPALGLRLESGDLVLMYTDGLVEADSGEAHFGVRRVLDVVRSGRHLPAEALIQALHGAVTEFLGSAPPLDDITAIVVKAE
ncbi:MAG: serine/threonine-protein phosphatase [Planctomycetes bacterium]|nr:serine/threonine-protein phosphatase [Planctomycetota bacterium]